MSGEERRRRLEIDVDEQTASAVRWSNRVTWLLFGFFYISLFTITILATLTGGVVVGVVTGMGLFLLGGVSMYEIDGTARFVTDKSTETVREELTSLSNPFTHGWLLTADDVFEAAESDDGDVILVLYRSTRLLRTKSVPIWVTELENGDIELRFGDENTPATTRLSIEPEGGNTYVRFDTHRDGLPGVALITSRLNYLTVRRRIGHHDYRLLEHNASIGISR